MRYSRFVFGSVMSVTIFAACSSSSTSSAGGGGGSDGGGGGSSQPATNCASRCATKATSCGASASDAAAQCQSVCASATEGDIVCAEAATCAALIASKGHCPTGSGSSSSSSSSSGSSGTGGSCIALGATGCDGAHRCCTDKNAAAACDNTYKRCGVMGGKTCSTDTDCWGALPAEGANYKCCGTLMVCTASATCK